MDMKTQVLQALARGYCHPKNSHKEMDFDLVEAMAEEVENSFTPAETPGHDHQ